MKLLLIDDDADIVEVIQEELSRAPHAIEIATAGSQSKAVDFLREEFFDLVLCDLKLPVEEGGLDADVVHGLAVYGEMQKSAPGTPVIFFSAFDLSIEVMQRLLTEASRDDPFGTGGEQPMIAFHPKNELHECLELIQELGAAVHRLNQLEIDTGLTPVTLSEKERRVIKLFAARHSGSLVGVTPLAGGLSTATVLRLTVRGAAGELRASVVAKIASSSAVQNERQVFDSLVAAVLPTGTYTPLATPVIVGAAELGGLFYTPVPGEDQHLFARLKSSPTNAADTVAVLDENLKAWRESVPTNEVTLLDLRDRFLTEEDFALALSRCPEIQTTFFDEVRIVARITTQHGDLHPFNVLLDGDRPILIDFGRAGPNLASIDPVTLELSLLFHPDANGVVGGWPSLDQTKRWPHLDDYVAGCPAEDFVRACRAWAHRAAGGSREVYASAFWYAIRQLKFEDTNHELACAIALGCYEVLRAP